MKYSKYGIRGNDHNKISVKSEKKRSTGIQVQYGIQYILTSNQTQFWWVNIRKLYRDTKLQFINSIHLVQTYLTITFSSINQLSELLKLTKDRGCFDRPQQSSGCRGSWSRPCFCPGTGSRHPCNTPGSTICFPRQYVDTINSTGWGLTVYRTLWK